MRVGLLGPLELEAGSPALGPRDRLVLAALAMRRGQWMAADALADVLWPDQPPATWVKVVQGCVSRLRRVLGPESIETSPSGYRLRPELVELDVVELEDLVARARSGLAEGAAERAVAGFERALGLWRGRPLTELEEWPPAQLEAARLTELHLAAEEERLTAMLAAGRHQEVVGEAMVQARQQPLREGRWITLALAQYRCGRQADALASIRAARRILGQQLGLDPGSELADLERKILEQSPSLAADHEVRATSAACPWRGLASYDAEDVDTFFGREEDVAACLGRLVDSPLLVLAGPSGSGKSSLMKAGLIPALALQGRASVVCTPGADPVGAIAAARASSTARDVVLCVDQAEEALADRDEDLVPWLRALIDHADARGPVILTLRADHLPALALDPEFARLAERGLHLVSPLADDQLRQVIEEPARVAGLRLEHGLVDLMLRDAEDQPGALPLLSHALAETWQRRDGSLLTVDGYRESGGISGAVAASADRVYDDLTDQQRGQLRWLMLRMAGLADAGDPVRTPVDREVALSDPDRARVLDLLVRTRLVTGDQSQYELAHEALVRAWPRLRTWLEEDQVSQRVWRHLASSAVEWDGLGRPANELYTGVRLESALEWADRPESMPTNLEREFLQASRDRADAERQQLAAQAQQERRQNRRLRILLAGLAVVLVAAMVAGVLAVLQARRADRQSVAAIASAVGAKALKADDPQLALLLAAAAEQVAPTADTLRSLSSVIANRPLLGRVVSMPQSDDPGGVVTTIDRVFVMDSRAVVRAFDTQLRPVGTYDAGDGHRATLGPPFAADDDLLVVGATPGDPRPIRLLDPATLTELPHQLHDLPTDVYLIDLSLSANGRRLAVVYSPATAEHPAQEDVPNTIRVWDLTTGLPAGPPIQAQARLNGELTDARWTGAGLSADGSTVYTSSPVAAYDVASGEPTWRHTNVSTWNNAMDVNGHLLATDVTWPSSPGVQLFDTRTGEHTMTLPSDIGGIQEIVFSRDGAMVAATGTTGRATVWDVESGQSIYTIDTGGPPLASGAFSTFGGTLYVMKPFRRQLQAWDLGNGTDRFVPRVGFDQIPGYANGQPRLTRDGTRLAIEGYTGDDTHPFGLTIFDLTSLQLFDVPVVGTPTHENGGWLGAGAWSPSGDQYAAGYGGGWVQVIDAGSGTETNRRRVSDDGIAALSYAGSGRLVAATQDGHVLLLDAETLQQVGTTVSLPEGATDVAGFSDGRTALVLGAGADRKLTWAKGGRTWYRVGLGSGRVVQTGRLTMRQGLVLALAPDERRFAVGGVDGLVEIVDTASGRPIRPAVSDGAGVIGHLAFDAGSDRLAVGVDIGRPLGLWDARTGTPLAATSLVEDRPGAAVAFAADGRVLAASSSGDVWAWDVSAAYAVRYACRVAGRDLTRQEWSDAFGSGVPYRSTCSDR